MSVQFVLKDPDEKNVKIIETILQNDIYVKYKIEANVQGEMICSTDKKVSRTKKFDMLLKETYKDYLLRLSNIPSKNYQWIYNIIDGKDEQESILYTDEFFTLIPTYTWDKVDMSKIHILAIVKDKNLRTIRSLTSKHIPLLEHILEKSLENITLKYKIAQKKFRIYIHHHPSTWHLHVHFNLVENSEHDCIVNGAHDFRQVIFNLKMCGKYYQMIDMYVLSEKHKPEKNDDT